MRKTLTRQLEDLLYVAVLSSLLIGLLVGIGIAGLCRWGSL